MKPHKISTHLDYSDNCYFHVFYQLSDWVEILQGFTKFNFKLNLKVSAFYLEKQKSFIPKKNIFLAVVNIKTKKLCLLTQFSGWFWLIALVILKYNNYISIPKRWKMQKKVERYWIQYFHGIISSHDLSLMKIEQALSTE